MKKIIFWSIVSIVIVGITVGAFLWLRKPQVMTLSDGTKLTLLNVEYGKHHKFPAVKAKPGVRRGNGGPSSFDTTNDTLVVWILQERKRNQYPNYQLMVYDEAQTACVGNWARTTRQANQIETIAGVQLNAYPRWDRKIILRVVNHGQQVPGEQFVVSNPARVSAAKWTAEPLPDTQSDGDLDVTLTRLIYGVRGFNNNSGSMKNDPINKAVLAAFRAEQKGVVMTNWQPIRIETSDAAGNKIKNDVWSITRDNGEVVMTYQWGLWPGESPWKLRVEMSQMSGFKDDELWAVQNVPVNPGSEQELWGFGGRDGGNKAAFAETTLNGFHLKLFPAIQFTNQNQGIGEKPGGFRVQSDQSLDGMQMTLVMAIDEQGRVVQNGGGDGEVGDSRQFPLQDLRNAKTLNITVALRKGRFVEFTVKPSNQ